MTALPTTTSLLLASLRESESGDTWRMFDGRYRPVLFAFGRKLGLTEQDAQEVAQDTLAAFVQEYRDGRYDRERGRLRSWLFSLARSRAARRHREMCKNRDWRGESAMEDMAGEDESQALFDAQWRNAVLREGLRRLRETRMDPKTLLAFERVTLDELPVDQVAGDLKLSRESVYVARFRVLQKLRGILEHVESDFER